MLGIPRAIVLRPEWMLERQLEGTLRGFGELAGRARPCGWPRTRTAASACCSWSRPQVENAEDRRKAESMREAGRDGPPARRSPRPTSGPLLPLLRMGAARREVEIKKVSADVKSRTAQITLDARLQVAAVGHPQGGGQEEPGADRAPRCSST